VKALRDLAQGLATLVIVGSCLVAFVLALGALEYVFG
jgi:hypothetical protein